MNADFPQNEREQLEAKLTALLLGELPADEAIALGKAMERDPKLAALYERLKATIGLVRESAANPAAETTAQAEPLKLSEERREKLLAQFKTLAPKEFAGRNRIKRDMTEWVAVAAALIIVTAIAVPNFVRTRETARKNTIVNTLRLLDGAKQQWALENGKADDATPTFGDIQVYLGRGGNPAEEKKLSVAGEGYVVGKVSNTPSVELSVSQAKKMFGSKTVARGETHDGKVRLSLNDLTDQPVPAGISGELAQSKDAEPSLKYQILRASPRDGKAIPVAPPSTPPAPKTEIVLPASSQFAVNNSEALIIYGDTTTNRQSGHGFALIGPVVQTPPPDSSENKFVARYGYVPPGQTLDIAAIHDQTRGANTDTIQLNYAAPSDISGALAKLENTNLIADTSGKLDDKAPVLGDVPALGHLFRNELKLADSNGRFYSGSTRDDVGGLSYTATNGVVASQSAGGDALKWESFDEVPNTITAGPIPDSSTGEGDRKWHGGRRGAGQPGQPGRAATGW